MVESLTLAYWLISMPSAVILALPLLEAMELVSTIAAVESF